MDKAVRQEILLELEQDTDLTDVDRSMLIEEVEECEEVVRAYMTGAMKAQPETDPEELVEKVLCDLVMDEKLDGRSAVLQDPDHEIWRDPLECEKQFLYTLQTWMYRENWTLGDDPDRH